jgi:hypothetical protein
MSTASTSYAGGILTTQFNTEKCFLGGNKYITATYTNGTGSTVTLTSGQLVGRIRSSGKIKPHVSSATDGSQIPIGVLRIGAGMGGDTIAVVDGASATVKVCYTGDINANTMSFGGSDTLATMLLFSNSSDAATTTSAGCIEDVLCARGFQIFNPTQNSLADN